MKSARLIAKNFYPSASRRVSLVLRRKDLALILLDG